MTEIKLISNVLKANDQIAAENRELLSKARVLVINLMSSPGSGKTTILERTIERTAAVGTKAAAKAAGDGGPVAGGGSAVGDGPTLRFAVVEGDLFTTRDAERIDRLGVPVVQVNTEGGCHLDAQMVRAALGDLAWREADVLVVENVGNLVCPAAWDLGEDQRVLVCSVTEGHDKPGKYPRMFREAQAILVNKIDLLPMTDFSVREFEKDVRALNAEVPIFYLSARTGAGVADWVAWLRGKAAEKRGRLEVASRARG